jgi:hypothetical protein
MSIDRAEVLPVGINPELRSARPFRGKLLSSFNRLATSLVEKATEAKNSFKNNKLPNIRKPIFRAAVGLTAAGFLIALASADLNSSLIDNQPSIASAAPSELGGVQIPNRRPWSSRHWFPGHPELGHPNLPTLAKALEAYSPEAAAWHSQHIGYNQTPDAGECPALAATGILDVDGPANLENETKIAPLVALRKGSVALPVKGKENIFRLVQNGKLVAVNAPELPGTWWRIAYGTKDRMLAVTNFGIEDPNNPHTVSLDIVHDDGFIIVEDSDPRSQAPQFLAPVKGKRNPFLNPENPDHIAKARSFARTP